MQEQKEYVGIATAKKILQLTISFQKQREVKTIKETYNIFVKGVIQQKVQ